MALKKAQFGFGTAFAFLVILLIIVSFNIWKSLHFNTMKIRIDVKENELLKVYPIFDYHVSLDYGSDVLSLNFYELIDIYLRTEDSGLVNEYCKEVRKTFDIRKLYLSINEKEFEMCSDKLDASSIFTTYYNRDETPIKIGIGVILKLSHDDIYFNFFEEYKKDLEEK